MKYEAGLIPRIRRDSIVRGVLEENEDMLREIDLLRETVTKQAQELFIATKRIHVLESQLGRLEDAEDAAQEKADVSNNVEAITPVDKTGILRSIFKAISSCQFGDSHKRIRAYKQGRLRKSAEKARDFEDKRQKKSELLRKKEKDVLGNTLHESNQRLDEVSSLLQSYRETPSFLVGAYDELVIDCLMEIIRLSKKMNLMTVGDFGALAD
ncbi:hypothetical protein MOQ_002084 [Trypanosoma cruzi marinkellei]|uniref:Uncharacterized protein n=1 Tax=Trypanosoma cruzi marinkellei TaxID=85056 RepID=K2MR04_TRYCR|nr:hypothetical protein MOQ_002084 [Trypanosoma cruzi marinkellei]